MPYRIALGALLAIAAIWFVALRPKSDTTPSTPPSAPGVTGLANAVNKAKGASAASDAANARIQAATGGATATTGSTAGTATGSKTTTASKAATALAKPATPVAPGDPSAPLIAALDKGKVVAISFYGKGTDDDSVRRAIGQLPRHGGFLVTKVAPISQVGKYLAITKDVQVTVAPTTLVINPQRLAVPIVGFTTKMEIDQAVRDALIASGHKKQARIGGRAHTHK
jgi:hypothetical protein